MSGERSASLERIMLLQDTEQKGREFQKKKIMWGQPPSAVQPSEAPRMWQPF
jgi:hypothetical protein